MLNSPVVISQLVSTRSAHRWDFKAWFATGTVSCMSQRVDEDRTERTFTATAVRDLLARLTPRDMDLLGVDGGVGLLTGLVCEVVAVLPTLLRPTRPCVDGTVELNSWTQQYNTLVKFASDTVPPGEKALQHVYHALRVLLDDRTLRNNQAAAVQNKCIRKTMEGKFGDPRYQVGT